MEDKFKPAFPESNLVAFITLINQLEHAQDNFRGKTSITSYDIDTMKHAYNYLRHNTEYN
tara:strand:- start:3 stop:182 length:180 start_codon:yes stop_codon:yes gene_type:complete